MLDRRLKLIHVRGRIFEDAEEGEMGLPSTPATLGPVTSMLVPLGALKYIGFRNGEPGGLAVCLEVYPKSHLKMVTDWDAARSLISQLDAVEALTGELWESLRGLFPESEEAYK